MNLGISNAQSVTWKRIKIQHIIMAGAAALAVSALVGGLSLRNDAPASSATRVAGPASISQPSPYPKTFVYVVGSQAEAVALEQSFNEGANLEAGTDAYRTVMVVDSPEAEEGLVILQGELRLAGTADSVAIVDLRFGGPVTGIPSPADVEVSPGAYPLVQETSNP